MRRLLFATIMLLSFIACDDKDIVGDKFVLFEPRDITIMREEGKTFTIVANCDCVPQGIRKTYYRGNELYPDGATERIKWYPVDKNDGCFDESLLQEYYEGFGCRLDIHNQRQYTITLDANIDCDDITIFFYEIQNNKKKTISIVPSGFSMYIR